MGQAQPAFPLERDTKMVNSQSFPGGLEGFFQELWICVHPHMLHLQSMILSPVTSNNLYVIDELKTFMHFDRSNSKGSENCKWYIHGYNINEINEIELSEMTQVNKEDHYSCSQHSTWPKTWGYPNKESLGLYISTIVHFSLFFKLTIPHICHGDQHRPQIWHNGV